MSSSKTWNLPGGNILGASISAGGGRRPQARRLAAWLLAAALPLAGCGFSPVYGDNSTSVGPAAQDRLSHVAIDLIPDRIGQTLRNELIDQFYRSTGRPADATAHLSVGLASFKENLGIQKDATATRARLRVTANVNLIDNVSGKVLYHTDIRSIVSYDISQAQFSTLVTEQDGYNRAVEEIGKEITMRLALYFDRESKT